MGRGFKAFLICRMLESKENMSMNTTMWQKSGATASRIIQGCMRIDSLDTKRAEELLKTAIDSGINFFDHADIYGSGECERIFAKALKLSADERDRLFLQSKCGIREGMFDFSRDHILTSVEGILERLQTEYLDFLLLHRPDTLMEPEEVAEAFDRLSAAGKVRNFGVSNQNPAQIELLQSYLGQRLQINQLQFGIMHTGIIDQGFNVNMKVDASADRDGSILDYCRLNDIVIQAWSPYQYGFFEGVFLGNEKFPELNRVLDEIADAHGISPTALATVWILRHPARMQVVVGSTNTKRVVDIAAASETEISREEWYRIYRAAGNTLP